MLYDPNITYISLPDGIYPSDFTSAVVEKNGISRVFYVIGRGGLLEQPLSQDLKNELVDRISNYVSSAYQPNREVLRKDVEKLLLGKNYPEALAHARSKGHIEETLGEKCKIAMDDLFFCFKRNNGGLLKETKNALLALIDEAARYSLKAGAYPTKQLSEEDFKERIWETITKQYSGALITSEDLNGISPHEFMCVTQELNERNKRRWNLNERRLARGLPLLKPFEQIIAEKMILPDQLLEYESKNQ